MRVSPTKAFLRDLKKVSKQDQTASIEALELFVSNHKAKKLNFEPVRSRSGYFTIRATYSIRILLRQTEPYAFDVVAIGNHDYVYASYFR